MERYIVKDMELQPYKKNIYMFEINILNNQNPGRKKIKKSIESRKILETKVDIAEDLPRKTEKPKLDISNPSGIIKTKLLDFDEDIIKDESFSTGKFSKEKMFNNSGNFTPMWIENKTLIFMFTASKKITINVTNGDKTKTIDYIPSKFEIILTTPYGKEVLFFRKTSNKGFKNNGLIIKFDIDSVDNEVCVSKYDSNSIYIEPIIFDYLYNNIDIYNYPNINIIIDISNFNYILEFEILDNNYDIIFGKGMSNIKKLISEKKIGSVELKKIIITSNKAMGKKEFKINGINMYDRSISLNYFDNYPSDVVSITYDTKKIKLIKMDEMAFF